MKLNMKAFTVSSAALFLLTALVYPLLAQLLWEPFTQAKMDALNKSGQSVLVTVHADWCTTCKTQERVLQELLTQPKFKQIKVLRLDFDQQKESVRLFGVQHQSTLIAFKKGHEVGRSTADVSPVRIAELLQLSL